LPVVGQSQYSLCSSSSRAVKIRPFLFEEQDANDQGGGFVAIAERMPLTPYT